MINFFLISTVQFGVLNTGQKMELQVLQRWTQIRFFPAFKFNSMNYYELRGFRKKNPRSLKHLSFYLKAHYLYFALLWRAWPSQYSHLLLSTTKKQPSEQVVP